MMIATGPPGPAVSQAADEVLCMSEICLTSHRPYGPVIILALQVRKSRLRGFKLLPDVMQPVRGRAEIRTQLRLKNLSSVPCTSGTWDRN